MATLSKTKTTLAAVTVLPPEAADLNADFNHARLLLSAVKGSIEQAAGLMVLFGIEARRLKKLHGVKAGRPANSRTGAGITWPEICKREFGVSDDTVARYILMADATKSRSNVLTELADKLLTVPLISLPAEDRERVEGAVRKITDGQTAKDLMQEWGIARKDARITEAHRHKGGNSTVKKSTPEEDAQERLRPLLALLVELRHGVTDAEFAAHLAALPLECSAEQSGTVATLSALLDELKGWQASVKAMHDAALRALRGK